MRELEPPEEEKESALGWLFGMVFVAVLAALILGAVFTFGPYFLASSMDNSRYRHGHSELYNLMISDTIHAMKVRFWVGAGIGAAVGAGFWLRMSRNKA